MLVEYEPTKATCVDITIRGAVPDVVRLELGWQVGVGREDEGVGRWGAKEGEVGGGGKDGQVARYGQEWGCMCCKWEG